MIVRSKDSSSFSIVRMRPRNERIVLRNAVFSGSPIKKMGIIPATKNTMRRIHICKGVISWKLRNESTYSWVLLIPKIIRTIIITRIASILIYCMPSIYSIWSPEINYPLCVRNEIFSTVSLVVKTSLLNRGFRELMVVSCKTIQANQVNAFFYNNSQNDTQIPVEFSGKPIV